MSVAGDFKKEVVKTVRGLKDKLPEGVDGQVKEQVHADLDKLAERHESGERVWK